MPRLSGHPHPAIDIIQPPGIGIPPMANMDAHQPNVTAALATVTIMTLMALRRACQIRNHNSFD